MLNMLQQNNLIIMKKIAGTLLLFLSGIITTLILFVVICVPNIILGIIFYFFGNEISTFLKIGLIVCFGIYTIRFFPTLLRFFLGQCILALQYYDSEKFGNIDAEKIMGTKKINLSK